MSVTTTPPEGLDEGGSALWAAVLVKHPGLGPVELVQLTEACRLKDRLDRLDALLRGDLDTWASIRERASVTELHIDSAASEARQCATVLKQLLAALRLPDEATGARPQQRGGARGAYSPSGKAGASKVSSILDRMNA